jgi:hypothetical protein
VSGGWLLSTEGWVIGNSLRGKFQDTRPWKNIVRVFIFAFVFVSDRL